MRVLGTNGRRTVLLGAVLALAGAGVISTAAPAFAATALTLNTVGGPSGGGNAVTASTGSTDTFDPTDATAQHVQFQYRVAGGTACAATYPAEVTITSSAGIVDVPTGNVTVTDTRNLTITVPARLALATGQGLGLYNVCIYGGTAGTDIPIADTTAGIGYAISPYKLSLSTYQGPSAGGNTISATTSGGSFSGGLGAEFQHSAVAYCSPTYVATAVPASSTVGTVLAPAVTPLTSTRVALTVPAGLVLGSGGALSVAYNLCIYDGTADGVSKLIAGTALPYVIATAATITGVTPSAGPAQGGTLITVTGTALTAGLTATVAGQALNGLTLTGSAGTGFTATVPPHAAGGPFNLVVTTLAGMATLVPGAGKTTSFTYTNGIVVAPTTAPNSSFAKSWIDVRGVGFSDLPFGVGVASGTTGATSNGTGAHVYLVRGTYDPKPTTTGGTVKTNPQTLECVDVVVIDDTELICGLFLAGNQASPVTTRTVSACTATIGTATLTGAAGSTTCTFTSADIGMAVTPVAGIIAAGTTIIAVPTPLTATLSKNTVGAVVAGTSLPLSSTRTISDAVFTLGGTTITTVSVGTSPPPFSATEIGHAISAPGVFPTGTVITGVSGGVATVSNPAIVASTATTGTAVTAFTPYPVSIGTYTVTVVSNGAPLATPPLGYSQSIISSGSTYTVADYLR